MSMDASGSVRCKCTGYTFDYSISKCISRGGPSGGAGGVSGIDDPISGQKDQSGCIIIADMRFAGEYQLRQRWVGKISYWHVLPKGDAGESPELIQSTGNRISTHGNAQLALEMARWQCRHPLQEIIQ